jgi:hypothetical protein
MALLRCTLQIERCACFFFQDLPLGWTLLRESERFKIERRVVDFILHSSRDFFSIRSLFYILRALFLTHLPDTRLPERMCCLRHTLPAEHLCAERFCEERLRIERFCEERLREERLCIERLCEERLCEERLCIERLCIERDFLPPFFTQAPGTRFPEDDL